MRAAEEQNRRLPCAPNAIARIHAEPLCVSAPARIACLSEKR
jgi:hypothetical protein